MERVEAIKRQAAALGFDACGIASLEPFAQEAAMLDSWLADHRNGTMHFLAEHRDKRAAPQLLLPAAKRAIVVLFNYKPSELQASDEAQIAKYAYGADYHYIVREKLYRLLDYISSEIALCTGTAFCDSAPVFERALAARAGLGWIGKNGLLIHSKLGSYCLIGELFVDIELPVDAPQEEHCGSCRRCLDACPTQALTAPYQIDARRCISYLTIEHRGPVDAALLPLMGKRLFGCDACLDVCPWNKKSPAHQHRELQAIEGLFGADWSSLTRGEFNRRFKHSPLQRAGLKKLRERAAQIEAGRFLK